ncbi:26S proteasome non-ATPase regulatory subunit 9 [Fasciola gigantica]|uniref:26S proteasome non-ATPase regulatory subunit 9 n=1 Tax=Fasciola gigantica TaxID=46835 RepID=A0A504Z373_FASGI|nr:26S proteasome non-ATPase regulatory subunit 9 [Fasciola gigantica]
MSKPSNRKRSVTDSDDSDELKSGTFRRMVNRSVSKFPRIAPAEPGGFSVRVVPAVAGIVTSDANTTEETDKPPSSIGMINSDEMGSGVAVIPTVRCSEKTGKPLCWQGGRLQSILLHDTFPQPQRVNRGDAQSVSVVGNATVKPIAARSSLPGASLFRTSPCSSGRGNRRGSRFKRESGQRHSSDASSDQEAGNNNLPASNLPTRSHSRKSNRSEAQVQPLLLPLREFHAPTDLSLPILDVTSKYDPFVGINADSKSGDCPTPVTTSGVGQTEDGSTMGNPSSNAAATTPSGICAAPVRMKSSGGMNDIDSLDLRGYRRLNGYQLFVRVNKKMHESVLTTVAADDTLEPAETQRDLHRKWQAIWSTLPEKTRKEWKTKAKRLMRHTGQGNHSSSQSSQVGKRFGSSIDRCQAEIRKIENQLARSDCVSTTLVDYAAYFQLLSDSFAAAARSLTGFDGPVSPKSVETMLLDGLLSCMIPLLALTAEEPLLADTDYTETTCDVDQARYQLRNKIQSLSLQKSDIEREIQSQSEILSMNGGIGLKGSLLDPEGYPRNDIDIVAVRTARNRIIRLNNDHRAVMIALEDALHQMHGLLRQVGSDERIEQDMCLDHEHSYSVPPSQTVLAPFLLIDDVRPGSMAEQSGLQVNDIISRFGSVIADNFSSLQDISSVLHNTPPQGTIPVIVHRKSMQNKIYHIELIKPSDASAIGLHVTPLPKP